MKWAIVVYAVLVHASGIPDDEHLVISWNLPFDTDNECVGFYNRNHHELKGGVVLHGQRAYNDEMGIKEMGCVKAMVDLNTWKPGDPPGQLSDKLVLYQRGVDL